MFHKTNKSVYGDDSVSQKSLFEKYKERGHQPINVSASNAIGNTTKQNMFSKQKAICELNRVTAQTNLYMAPIPYHKNHFPRKIMNAAASPSMWLLHK